MKRWRTDGFSRRWRGFAALGLLIAALATGRPDAGSAETPAPILAGFSPQKLQGIGDYFRNEVASGKIPGAVILVQQHAHPVYFKSFGLRDVATKIAMSPDTIFRLYSMS